MTIGPVSRAGLAYERTAAPAVPPVKKEAPNGGHYNLTISPEAVALAKAQKGG